MTTMFVSPHFDDVVLSCVAHVRAARAGGRVVVATVFGGWQAQREAENVAALDMLGAEPVVLPFADAPERLDIRPGFGALLLKRYASEARDTAAITEALATVQAEFHVTRTFLPLGVGGHVDHRVVHDTHPGLLGELLFFEDRPYADIPGALRARLLEIGAISSAQSLDPLPELTVLRDGVFDVFGRLLATQPDGHAEVEAFCQALLCAREGSPKVELAPDSLPTAPLSDEVIACYRSQIPDLFGDREGLRRFVAARAVERVWRLTTMGLQNRIG